MRYIKNCPHCHTLLEGEDIYEYFKTRYEAPSDAVRVALDYGWLPDNKCAFSRIVGLYDVEKDRTVSYQCPDCEAIIENPYEPEDKASKAIAVKPFPSTS